MSTHKVEVVKLGPVRKHPNADSLGLVDVWGYTCAVRLGEWNEGDLAAYIEPDYVVPNDERFAFLGGRCRIKPVRLRGQWSQGLLVRPPDGAVEGDDVMAALGVERYEPPETRQPGARLGNPRTDFTTPPSGFFPVYDVEPWRRYAGLLTEGEPVMVTEKLHGASCRFVWQGERLHVGSRKNWWKPDCDSIWSRLARELQWIAAWCERRPGVCLYGEVYGQVQDLKYDCGPGELRFLAFDAWLGQAWMDIRELRASCDCVPLLYDGPYHRADIEAMGEGQSTIAGNVREGCVIRTVPLRYSNELNGMVQLKCVGNGYLSRAKG